MARVFKLVKSNQKVKAEGFTGEKKELYQDVWPDLYAARQNQGIILQAMVTATEEIDGQNGKKTPCAVIMYGSAKGLITLEESGCKDKRELDNMIGQLAAFKVIAIDEKSNLFGASRKQALEQMSRKTWDNLEVDQVVTAVVKKVSIGKARVDIGGIAVDIPSTEMGYGWVNDVREIVSVNDNIDVKVIDLDKENKKVKLSYKAMYPNPWPGVTKRYKKNMKCLGVVSGVENYGVFVNLEPGVDMLCKQQIERFRPAIKERVIVRILHIDPKKEQIYGVIDSSLDFKR